MELERRIEIIKKLHPTWDDDFITEMLHCPYANEVCCNVEKHNLNDCDNCPVTYM